MSISSRAIRGVAQENLLLECFGKVLKNPFHHEKNPTGIINMGTSENKLMHDILHAKIAKINLGDFDASNHHYCDMRGTPQFRKALAVFLDRYMKPSKPINMNDIFVMNGCGSVVEMLAFSICDDGEGFLIPAPYYGAFKTDIMCRMGCIAYPANLSSTPNSEYGETMPFEVSTARLEIAYKKAKSEGIKIRGVILANPNNPLGYVYSKSQLISYLKFADRYKLHVILDEIYLLSIFKEGATMTTGLSLEDGVIDPSLLHIVWGFSKDFGLSGLRCGLVHTVNKELAKVIHSNSYFQSTPTVSQFVLQALVSDFDWLDKVYFPTNLKLLREAHGFVKKEFQEVGVKILDAPAGLYIWVDLRSYVKPLSREGELKLMDLFLKNGVYITPGVAFQSAEYGWFRIIISVGLGLKQGMQRIKAVLQKMSDGKGKDPLAEDSLDDLAEKLQKQMHDSQWLKENSAEKWAKENPELAEQFEKEREKKV